MTPRKTRRGLNLPADVFEKIEAAQNLLSDQLGIPTLTKAQALDRILNDFIDRHR